MKIASSRGPSLSASRSFQTRLSKEVKTSAYRPSRSVATLNTVKTAERVKAEPKSRTSSFTKSTTLKTTPLKTFNNASVREMKSWRSQWHPFETYLSLDDESVQDVLQKIEKYVNGVRNNMHTTDKEEKGSNGHTIVDDRRTYSGFRADTYFHKDNYIITAELPGVKKENLKITVEDSILFVEGERPIDENGEKKYTRRELIRGSFARKFPLPDGTDATKIKATFEDGILKLTIPRKEKHTVSVSVE